MNTKIRAPVNFAFVKVICFLRENHP